MSDRRVYVRRATTNVNLSYNIHIHVHVWYLCWVDIIFKEIESALVVVGSHVPIPIPPDPILESAEFQVLSLDGKVWVFDTGCPEEAVLWVKAIEEQIKKMYSENVSHKRMVGETVCLCVPVFVHVKPPSQFSRLGMWNMYNLWISISLSLFN